MSKGLWWGLAASVAVAIIICIVAAFVTWRKVRKVKRQYQQDMMTIERELALSNKALEERKNHGELLWELKSKSKNPLGDEEIEFLLNTAIRNLYKTLKVLGSASNYEVETFEKIASMKNTDKVADLTMIFNGEDMNDNFDKEYKTLAEKKMIVIVNAPRTEKRIKDLIKYLRTIGAKYEWVNYGKGIVLVVK